MMAQFANVLLRALGSLVVPILLVVTATFFASEKLYPSSSGAEFASWYGPELATFLIVWSMGMIAMPWLREKVSMPDTPNNRLLNRMALLAITVLAFTGAMWFVIHGGILAIVPLAILASVVFGLMMPKQLSTPAPAQYHSVLS